jgi:hypothetical protein
MDHLRLRLEETFRLFLDHSFTEIMTATWEDTWNMLTESNTALLNCLRDKRFPSTTKFEGYLKRLFDEHVQKRTAEALEELKDYLLHHPFLNFHIKQAVQNSVVQAVETEKRALKDGEEWNFIHMNEIEQAVKVNVLISNLVDRRTTDTLDGISMNSNKMQY